MPNLIHTSGRDAGPDSRSGVGAELIDIRAVADMLGCSTRHVSRMAKCGKMPKAKRLGVLVRWSRKELDTWIAGGCGAWEGGGQ